MDLTRDDGKPPVSVEKPIGSPNDQLGDLSCYSTSSAWEQKHLVYLALFIL